MRTEHTPKNHRIKDFSKEPRASARGIIGRGCVLGAATPKPLLAIHPRASARGILADFVKLNINNRVTPMDLGRNKQVITTSK